MPLRKSTSATPLGLRLRQEDRRVAQRRTQPRLGRERRRSDRRRQMLISLMATGLSLGWHTAPPKLLLRPQVDVSTSNMTPIEADRIYESLVTEAASTFDLDPDLLRAVIQAESAFDTSAVS